MVIVLVILITMTNFNFTIYKLYMKLKPKSNNRLLNVLHWFHASLLQFGTFLILFILADKFEDKVLNYTSLTQFIPSQEVFIQIRMLHLSCVFLNNFNIGMATVILHFKKKIYLHISKRITKKILLGTTFLISILINIFIKYTLREDEKDYKEELVSYQFAVQIMCFFLNMSSLLMSCVVLLAPHFFALLEWIRSAARNAQHDDSPSEELEISTIEIGGGQTSNDEDLINTFLDNEEHIR